MGYVGVLGVTSAERAATIAVRRRRPEAAIKKSAGSASATRKHAPLSRDASLATPLRLYKSF